MQPFLQLTDAALIRRLRDLDLPLDAIGRVLHARDPDVTRKVLHNTHHTDQSTTP
jgi:DNA-binding transcriptional MerR regulator